MTSNIRRGWALYLAERGWRVFPLLPGLKVPALHGDTTDRPCPRTGPCRDGHRGWEHLATNHIGHIGRYWDVHPSHNIGLACGPSGLVVIDLDVARAGKPLPQDCISAGAIHGAQMLGRLARQNNATVPDTWTVRTPSGGTHLYFRAPDGPDAPQLRNTRGGDRGALAGLIDTRAHGGYVVAPGSIAPEGGYELISDHEPAPLPGWLVHRLSVRPPTAISAPRTIATDKVNAYVTAAIDGEGNRIRTAKPGTHNRAQYIAAAALGQLVGGGYLDHTTALQSLIQHAAGHITGPCHCTESGVTAALESGLRYGANHPRRLDNVTGQGEKGGAAA